MATRQEALRRFINHDLVPILYRVLAQSPAQAVSASRGPTRKENTVQLTRSETPVPDADAQGEPGRALRLLLGASGNNPPC
jgi:hypothetical protein